MRQWWIACGLMLIGTARLGAQTMPSDSASGGLPADQMLRDMLKPQPNAPAAQPTTRPLTTELHPQGYVEAPAIHLLREGFDVVGRSGVLHNVANSPYPQIVFDDKPGMAHLPPMYVLPNLRLMSMEDAAEATKRHLHFNISGTLTEYGTNNFILLDTGAEDVSSDLNATNALHPINMGSASPEQMLSDMLGQPGKVPAPAPKPIPPSTDQTSGSGAVSPSAPVLTVLRDESQLIDRVGRLTRSADGQQQELSLEADGSTLQDPPLIILPNLKLTEMEKAQASSNHDPRFRVTGTVTEYRGRNYILLQKVVVVPEATEQF